jgi:hypothetical protein
LSRWFGRADGAPMCALRVCSADLTPFDIVLDADAAAHLSAELGKPFSQRQGCSCEGNEKEGNAGEIPAVGATVPASCKGGKDSPDGSIFPPNNQQTPTKH